MATFAARSDMPGSPLMTCLAEQPYYRPMLDAWNFVPSLFIWFAQFGDFSAKLLASGIRLHLSIAFRSTHRGEHKGGYDRVGFCYPRAGVVPVCRKTANAEQSSREENTCD